MAGGGSDTPGAIDPPDGAGSNCPSQSFLPRPSPVPAALELLLGQVTFARAVRRWRGPAAGNTAAGNTAAGNTAAGNTAAGKHDGGPRQPPGRQDSACRGCRGPWD